MSLERAVREVAASCYLGGIPLDADADGDCVYLGEFTLERADGFLCVYRVRDIPGGQHADPVCADIPCDATGAEARAAVALLRAWVNQSLDFAALAASQPEEV